MMPAVYTAVMAAANIMLGVGGRMHAQRAKHARAGTHSVTATWKRSVKS